MLTLIRAWITPKFQDEELYRRAFALNVITLSGLLLSFGTNGTLIIIALMRGSNNNLGLFSLVLLFSLLWFAIIYGLTRRARVSLASHVFLWGGIALIAGGTLGDFDAGVSDSTWYLLTLTVVGATLLLGARWSVIFAVIDTLIYLAVALAQHQGWVYPRAEPLPLADIPFPVVMMSGILLTQAAFAWLIGSGLERALDKAKSQTQELEQAKRRLQDTQTYLEQTIEKTVDEYTTFAQQVAQGDLNVRLTLQSENPLYALGQSLNAMVQGLHQISQQVQGAVESINSAASEIMAATSQQASGAKAQAAAIAETTSTIDEVRAIAEQSSQRAQSVADLAQRTADTSQHGQQVVSDTVNDTQEMRSQVESIASDILALSEQTRAIGEIIATVNEIASQSHMLALNAAVEAARAGEAGRGFAVVAGEVRRLAEQSRAATEQIRQILSDIQHGVNAAVLTTEQGSKQADAGMRLAQQAGEAIQHLTQSVSESAQSAVQITAAANQQLTGMQQITQAMDNIYQVSIQNEAGADQVRCAAQDLNSLAAQLNELVEQYKL